MNSLQVAGAQAQLVHIRETQDSARGNTGLVQPRDSVARSEGLLALVRDF